MKWNGIAAAALVVQCLFTAGAQASDSREEAERELAKPIVRGGIVFKTYCKLCHGEVGDGVARATKLYGNVSLEIGRQSPEYFDKIIRQGGTAIGRSEFMPPWQDELSDEQVKDVVAYLSIITAPQKRGEAVFKANCLLCHGVKGDGKGRASVLFNPPPANLTVSDKNDEYKKMIITLGGAAMGRSEVMPVWGEQLSSQEIDDVVKYLRTLLVVPPPQ
jgi:cytochrome c oxidase cbb3-type subunit 3